MPSNFDPYMPGTKFQFRDAGTLMIGTKSCQDQIHQAVYLCYTPEGATTPTMELELPPKSVEVIIQHLQERANEARFVNGEKMLDYSIPRPVKAPGSKPARPGKRKVKKATRTSSASAPRPPSAL
jgi:hypothetical protein